MNTLYLDNNATTQLAEEVGQAILSIYTKPLNPSSIHHLGKEGKKLLGKARQEIAAFLNVTPETLYFTSCGTESMNLLIQGLYQGGKILSTKVEHSCVFETVEGLKSQGATVEYIQVDDKGAPEIEKIKSAIDETTTLMIFSAVYTETGALLDLKGCAQLAKETKTTLIIDGVGILGKESFQIFDGITGMGFSAHKLHGPKGSGLIYLSDKTPCKKMMYGGHQEKELRPGTENLEGAVGFAKAVSLLSLKQETIFEHLRDLRDYFEKRVMSTVEKTHINGSGPRVSNTSNLYFEGIDNETLLLALDRCGICASAGSACSSGALEPSRVLLNMGLSRKRAKGSLRFSFSRYNTKEQIDKAVDLLKEIVEKLRG